MVCNNCEHTFHQKCLKMHANLYKEITTSGRDWTCPSCIPVEEDHSTNDSQRGTLKWGTMLGIDEINNEIEKIHLKITTWKKNIFQVPKGKAGNSFIAECTNLLKQINDKTKWEPVAMNQLIIFMPLMLQKPSRRSKRKDHAKYLLKRLEQWKNGQLKDLMSEAEEIQKRMEPVFKRKESSHKRRFTQLMLEGKVRQALRLVDANGDISGVHSVTPEIMRILEEKHPPAAPLHPDAICNEDMPKVEEVIFESIDGKKVYDACRNMDGSGGPTKIDSDLIKQIVCSRVFGKLSEELADAIALATRRICTESIPNKYISLLLDNRLIPLIKDEVEVRPIGIGEILRRLMGKCVAEVVGNDVQLAGGALQTCTGIEAGIEAAVHAMTRIFEDEKTEGVLLIDALNAFNLLCRNNSLEYVKHRCPTMYRFLHNTYQSPSRLHLGDGSPTPLLSQEGVTQGDPLAMAMYAVSTRKMINTINQNYQNISQVWFADDSAVGGLVADSASVLDHLETDGPKDGYYPKPPKCKFIPTSKENREKATIAFKGKEVKIVDGNRYLGGFLGT